MALKHVGRPIKRFDDPKPIQGADPYVADVTWAAISRR